MPGKSTTVNVSIGYAVSQRLQQPNKWSPVLFHQATIPRASTSLRQAEHNGECYDKLLSHPGDDSKDNIADIRKFIADGAYKEGESVEDIVDQCFDEIKEVFDSAEKAGVGKDDLDKLREVLDTTYGRFEFVSDEFVPKSHVEQHGGSAAANGVPGEGTAPLKRPRSVSPTAVVPTKSGVSNGTTATIPNHSSPAAANNVPSPGRVPIPSTPTPSSTVGVAVSSGQHEAGDRRKKVRTRWTDEQDVEIANAVLISKRETDYEPG
eukprot:gene26327-18175_t